MNVDRPVLYIFAGLPGVKVDGPEGYMAGDNLRLGLNVVADSVNPLQITRIAWRRVATEGGVEFVDIEVMCSDPVEHRRRVETRVNDIPGHRLPTWEEVRSREYEEWDRPVVRIDTAGRGPGDNLELLMRLIGIRD